jgi:hypothetical protein
MKKIALSMCASLFFVFHAHGQQSPHGPLTMACGDCHTTASWTELLSPMKFDHARTAFQLQGRHKLTECKACHTTLRFAGTEASCYGCHQKDYEAHGFIDHEKAGFSTECEQCHTTDAQSWLENFDHNKTQFPTRGAHDGVACAQCHVNNRYRGTTIQCVACHQKEYDTAKFPDHRSAKFNTDCAVCHRALTWQPAAFFPHESYFPITAGARHSPGVWGTCADCHANQSNYAAFECINCHHHSKASTDASHSGRNGYQYLSSACYRCHPQGEAG